MKSGRSLSNLRLNMMLMLSVRPRYGYELIKDLETLSGRKVGPGQIYPLLKQLQSNRLVQIMSRGERDKKVYALTKTGKRVMTDSISKLGGLLDFFLKSKLTACAHCNCEIYKGGYSIHIRSKMLHFCCKNCAKSYESMD